MEEYNAEIIDNIRHKNKCCKCGSSDSTILYDYSTCKYIIDNYIEYTGFLCRECVWMLIPDY